MGRSPVTKQVLPCWRSGAGCGAGCRRCDQQEPRCVQEQQVSALLRLLLLLLLLLLGTATRMTLMLLDLVPCFSARSCGGRQQGDAFGEVAATVVWKVCWVRSRHRCQPGWGCSLAQVQLGHEAAERGARGPPSAAPSTNSRTAQPAHHVRQSITATPSAAHNDIARVLRAQEWSNRRWAPPHCLRRQSKCRCAVSWPFCDLPLSLGLLTHHRAI